jgi:hypothetical protein
MQVSITAAQIPALTAYQQRIAAGLKITSTGTPALNATYGCDPQAEFNIVALETSLNANQGFPNGAATYAYPTITPGVKVTMTPAQFTEIAAAIRDYVNALDTTLAALQQGQQATWPANSVTIA